MSIFLQRDKRLLLGFWALLGVLLFVYCAYAIWITSSTISLPASDCDLRQGACVSLLPSGERIELHIKPTHMPVLTSLLLEVKTDNIPVKKAFIYFKGAEMNMGEFRYTLLHQKDSIYATQTILPTCIHDHMIWHAVVHIETSNKRYNAPFVFINQKPQTA